MKLLLHANRAHFCVGRSKTRHNNGSSPVDDEVKNSLKMSNGSTASWRRSLAGNVVWMAVGNDGTKGRWVLNDLKYKRIDPWVCRGTRVIFCDPSSPTLGCSLGLLMRGGHAWWLLHCLFE